MSDAESVDAFYASVPDLWASVNLAGGFAMAPIERSGAGDFAAMIDANARTALQEGDPARALALLEHQRFPKKFEGKRIALEVSALCQLDRKADAEARARTWRSAHADDPIAAELIGVCWSE